MKNDIWTKTDLEKMEAETLTKEKLEQIEKEAEERYWEERMEEDEYIPGDDDDDEIEFPSIFPSNEQILENLNEGDDDYILIKEDMEVGW